MTGISKERRDDIRLWIKGYNVPAASEHELRALLDLADERGRYRAMLGDARESLAIFEQVLRDHFPGSSVGLLVHRTRRERIEAALEGKTND